jgi:hypothetical protein
MAIPVEETTVGWTSVSLADVYFLASRLSSPFWDALVVVSGGRDQKSAVLSQAYNRIRLSKQFSIPASPTADQLEKLQIAQCEMAYYLALHLADEDVRKGLQAQGVTAAGIVKETYSEAGLGSTPFPPEVLEWLDEFLAVTSPFYAVEIGRNENEDIDYDPTQDE